MTRRQSQLEWRREQRKQYVGMKHKGIVPFEHVDAADLKRLQAQIPQEDGRSLTAWFFGDPNPLDRRRFA